MMDYIFSHDILNSKDPPGLLAAMLTRTLRCLYDSLASKFYRFLARFSGRRRQNSSANLNNVEVGEVQVSPSFHRKCVMPPLFATLILVVSMIFSIAEACSSRSTPRPRPPIPTARPNITFLTYECPPAYAEWFCLNEATCFTVKIGDSLLYNCECPDGYMGQRCEYKDLDGSYLRSRQKVMLETASIASAATIAVFFVVIVCVSLYIHFRRRQKERLMKFVDGSSENERIRPFSRSLQIPIRHQTGPPIGSGEPELSGFQTENSALH